MSQGFGGLELYVVNVAKFFALNQNQDQSSYRCSVVTAKNSFIFKKLTKENIASTAFSPAFHHLPLISALKLARHIDAHKIDVVHVHWAKDLLLAVLAKVFSRRKVKLIYTRHMALTRKKDDFYHRFLYRNVDAYLVITKELYHNAVNYLPVDERKIHLLYHGVRVEKAGDCEAYLKEKGINEDVFRLVIFGRIEEGKGQHLVVDAVKRLYELGKNIQLAMIGHVMDKEYHATLVNTITTSNLENHVFYLGFHEQPTSIMPCFDAVVLATKCETFGLVLPEAMRAGVTVIGSNCGGVPEIIEHEKTGLLFETQNAIDLSLQLAKIIDDIDFRNSLAAAGKKYADEHFSEENHFKELIRIFESA